MEAGLGAFNTKGEVVDARAGTAFSAVAARSDLDSAGRAGSVKRAAGAGPAWVSAGFACVRTAAVTAIAAQVRRRGLFKDTEGTFLE